MSSNSRTIVQSVVDSLGAGVETLAQTCECCHKVWRSCAAALRQYAGGRAPVDGTVPTETEKEGVPMLQPPHVQHFISPSGELLRRTVRARRGEEPEPEPKASEFVEVHRYREKFRRQFYAVAVGERPGVYLKHGIVNHQVHRYSGAEAQSFAMRHTAKHWMAERGKLLDAIKDMPEDYNAGIETSKRYSRTGLDFTDAFVNGTLYE